MFLLSHRKIYIWHASWSWYLWCLEARVWSGKWDGWGCLFGVELAGPGGEGGVAGGGGGVFPKRCALASVQKRTPRRHGPASFPPDQLSSAQEWDTDTSSRLRHIIGVCQGLYQTGSTGARGLSPRSPQAAGYLHTHSFDTSPSQEAYRLSIMAAWLEARGCMEGRGTVAPLHCPDWKPR